MQQQIQGLEACGLEVDVLCVKRVEQGRKTYRDLGKAISTKLTEFNPDIVHALYGGLLAETVTRVVKDRPVLVSFCGTDLLGGSFFNFFKRMTVRLGVFASYLAAHRANGIIVKSENLKSALPQKIDRQKVWILPNGVDLNRFQPQDRITACTRLGWDPNCFNVLFADKAHRPHKRFELAKLAGEQVSAGGIPLVLRILTGVPHQEVSTWLNASNVLLLTSYQEGSPNIVKEALACNRPVVSLDIGDVKERIHDIPGCYIAEPNPSDIAEKLRDVFNGPDVVTGRQKVMELSLDQVAHRLITIYQTVIDGKDTPHRLLQSLPTPSNPLLANRRKPNATDCSST
ncbi:glycosyltransferase [Nitrospira sp. M1]